MPSTPKSSDVWGPFASQCESKTIEYLVRIQQLQSFLLMCMILARTKIIRIGPPSQFDHKLLNFFFPGRTIGLNLIQLIGHTMKNHRLD